MDFQSFMAAFKCAKLDEPEAINTKMVVSLMRPLFANVYITPIPPLDAFKDFDLDHEIAMTIRDPWTNDFTVKKESYWKMPLFRKAAFETWYSVVLPQF